MNWKQIKKDCPKAFDLLEKWDNHPAVLSRQKKRLLYDFFDKNKIYISVIGSMRNYDILNFQIFIIHHEDGRDYSTRTEAENVAFTEAFKILEQKLGL